jgi:hypothetical protein
MVEIVGDRSSRSIFEKAEADTPVSLLASCNVRRRFFRVARKRAPMLAAPFVLLMGPVASRSPGRLVSPARSASEISGILALPAGRKCALLGNGWITQTCGMTAAHPIVNSVIV